MKNLVTLHCHKEKEVLRHKHAEVRWRCKISHLHLLLKWFTEGFTEVNNLKLCRPPNYNCVFIWDVTISKSNCTITPNKSSAGHLLEFFFEKDEEWGKKYSRCLNSSWMLNVRIRAKKIGVSGNNPSVQIVFLSVSCFSFLISRHGKNQSTSTSRIWNLL